MLNPLGKGDFRGTVPRESPSVPPLEVSTVCAAVSRTKSLLDAQRSCESRTGRPEVGPRDERRGEGERPRERGCSPHRSPRKGSARAGAESVLAGTAFSGEGQRCVDLAARSRGAPAVAGTPAFRTEAPRQGALAHRRRRSSAPSPLVWRCRAHHPQTRGGCSRIAVFPERRAHSITCPGLGWSRDPTEVCSHRYWEGKTKEVTRWLQPTQLLRELH